jgi:hypothetical protein
MLLEEQRHKNSTKVAIYFRFGEQFFKRQTL